MQDRMDKMAKEIEENELDLSNIYTLGSEATNHAKALQQRAEDLRQILDRAKSAEIMRTLDAANAYTNINEFIESAQVAAKEALDASESAANTVS